MHEINIIQIFLGWTLIFQKISNFLENSQSVVLIYLAADDQIVFH